MKITFVTNFYNHHQKPLADEMHLLVGDDYYFIETSPITTERLNMGWGGEEKPPYVLQNYVDEVSRIKCQEIIDKADVVIIGSAPRILIRKRLKAQKLTFYYHERPYKTIPPFYKLVVHWLRNIKNIIRYKNLYLLCASAYTSADYAKVFTFKNKAYKWGYFTEVKRYDDVDKLVASKDENSILWVARMISWKHPEIAVEVANRLKNDGYDFKLNMIGNGELEANVKAEIEKKGLSDCVEMLGAMDPSMVRQHMERSEIFMFTSDRNEGWGAVLNESMNSGCAVVVNSAIGSAAFLIKDGESGYMYQDGDVDGLYNRVKCLLDDIEDRKRISKNAYLTITDEWNAENAAKRFVSLCEKMLCGEYKPFPYDDGVCSKAKILKDGWYKK